MPFDLEYWPGWLTAVWAIYIVLLGGWIVLQKRTPVATLSWILALAALPILGFVIYYYFGPQRLTRYRMRRARSRAALSAQDAMAQSRLLNGNMPRRWLALARLGAATCDAPLSNVQSLELLTGGRAKFQRLLSDIQQARHHIHLEYYIYTNDHTGTELLEALTAKAREGVVVRLMIDALGSASAHRRFLRPLLEAGGRVAWFHESRVGRRLRPVINFRNHRKIVVIDGCIGYTGGINVTDDGHEDRSEHAFRDVHLRFEGLAVHWLQMVFLEDWLYSTDQRQRSFEEVEDLLPPCPQGHIPVQILHAGPSDPREAIHRVWLTAIHEARRRVWLTTPYFVPTEAMVIALTSAAYRGLDVRVLIPECSDSALVSAAARSYYDELLAAGVKVWEYRGNMLHAKTLVIDSAACWVGTSNFDERSFALNFEVCAMVFDKNLAAQLSTFFEELLEESCQVDAQRRSSFVRSLADAGARLLAPLL